MFLEIYFSMIIPDIGLWSHVLEIFFVTYEPNISFKKTHLKSSMWVYFSHGSNILGKMLPTQGRKPWGTVKIKTKIEKPCSASSESKKWVVYRK